MASTAAVEPAGRSSAPFGGPGVDRGRVEVRGRELGDLGDDRVAEVGVEAVEQAEGARGRAHVHRRQRDVVRPRRRRQPRPVERLHGDLLVQRGAARRAVGGQIGAGRQRGRAGRPLGAVEVVQLGQPPVRGPVDLAVGHVHLEHRRVRLVEQPSLHLGQRADLGLCGRRAADVVVQVERVRPERYQPARQPGHGRDRGDDGQAGSGPPGADHAQRGRRSDQQRGQPEQAVVPTQQQDRAEGRNRGDRRGQSRPPPGRDLHPHERHQPGDRHRQHQRGRHRRSRLRARQQAGHAVDQRILERPEASRRPAGGARSSTAAP